MKKSHLPIRPELRAWILSTTHAGHGVDTVLRMMQETGYDPAQSRRIVASVLNMPELAVDARKGAIKAVRPRHPDAPYKLIDGHRVEVTLSVDAPALRVLHNMLSEDECSGLIEQSRSRLQRAMTVDSEGKQQIDHRRTGEGMFFGIGESPLVKCIEARIAALLNVPIEHGEGLQVLHYLPGQQYEPHHDWFDPAHPGYASITASGGQRMASIVMYLNTPEWGGGTAFPELGLTVTALRGSAVYFAYETGDTAALHAGLPVTKGEKWIATKWLRERPYKPSSQSKR